MTTCSSSRHQLFFVAMLVATLSLVCLSACNTCLNEPCTDETIEAFKAFTQAYIVSGGNGGPVDSTMFYTLYLYLEAFANFRMGYASALAWILLVIIGVFAWNYLMVGSLTSRSGVDHGFPLLEAIWEFRIPVSDILGYLREGMFSEAPAYFGLALLLLVCGICAYRLWPHWPAVAAELTSRATVQISLIYIVVTAIYMFYLTWGTSPGHVVPRYLATLFPFVLVTVFLLGVRLPPTGSPLTRSAGVLLVLMFVTGQANNATRLTDLQQQGSQLALYLERPHSAQQTLREYFRQVSTRGPIFTNEPQILGHYLDRPTVGATEFPFTTERFDADRVKQIVETYSVTLVVLFLEPPLSQPPQSHESAEIYRDLVAGRVPAWLTREYADDYLQIFRPLP